MLHSTNLGTVAPADEDLASGAVVVGLVPTSVALALVVHGSTGADPAHKLVGRALAAGEALGHILRAAAVAAGDKVGDVLHGATVGAAGLAKVRIKGFGACAWLGEVDEGACAGGLAARVHGKNGADALEGEGALVETEVVDGTGEERLLDGCAIGDVVGGVGSVDGHDAGEVGKGLVAVDKDVPEGVVCSTKEEGGDGPRNVLPGVVEAEGSVGGGEFAVDGGEGVGDAEEELGCGGDAADVDVFGADAVAELEEGLARTSGGCEADPEGEGHADLEGGSVANDAVAELAVEEGDAGDLKVFVVGGIEGGGDALGLGVLHGHAGPRGARAGGDGDEGPAPRREVAGEVPAVEGVE